MLVLLQVILMLVLQSTELGIIRYENAGQRKTDYSTYYIARGDRFSKCKSETLYNGGGSSKNLRGTGSQNLGLRGVTPLKTHRLWPICLLPYFSFLFFIFLPPWNFRGD